MDTIPLFKVFMPAEAPSLVSTVLNSGFIAEGQMVERFTEEVQNFIGHPYVVPTNSCTSALTIAYKLAGVEAGSEVITPALTCVAGNEPIALLGAKPVWCDVERETGMVTADLIAPLITENTRAIYVLHKEGAPAEIEDIYSLGESCGVKVIEDAAHAFGAKRNGKNIGTTGDYVCFSFQAIKHITTGDGGALLCKSEEDYERAKKAKWFGIDRGNRQGRDVWREDIIEWGLKANMNDIAGALGLSQIAHVEEILSAFHRNGRRYDEIFSKMSGIKTLRRDNRDFQTYWGYTVLVENRAEVMKALTEAGIGCGQIHVRNDIYSMFAGERRDLPNTDWVDACELSLPCGWWVNEEIQDYIIDEVKKAVQ